MNEPSPASFRSPATDPPVVRRRKLAVTVCLLVVLLIGAGSQVARWRLQSWTPSDQPPDRPWNNAPFITTPPEVIRKMLELAQVKESDVLYDLGCGDGRIGIAAAEESGCRVKGFDIEPERIRESKANAIERGVHELCEFEQKDIFTLDLSNVDVVVMYLLPRYGKRLVPQFEQMKPGSRIVSHEFDIEGIAPDQSVRIPRDDGGHRWVHLWILPLRKEETK